ncbi:hypothetical protein F3Y22_tig00110332pilonHSYRG01421 [Hibiscus syriacus]|uniref:C2H2-type domain-containing protein n=1 Tax=Hibiscus syriacus TaxID=106335 RepID=A0A6A3B0I3_HIBSY|nr:hypothetical protein F3Y22_tig00110332pilonHSYRG01421 [Hibiscus syriacus]
MMMMMKKKQKFLQSSKLIEQVEVILVPTCNKALKTYQGLGGHRASHKKMKAYPPPATIETEIWAPPLLVHSTPVPSSKKLGDSSIDLNLPAPTDDDDASQIELSAVSDAEFVTTCKGKNFDP